MLWKMTRPAAIRALPREAANPSRENQAPSRAEPGPMLALPFGALGLCRAPQPLCLCSAAAEAQACVVKRPSVPGTKQAVTFKTITS